MKKAEILKFEEGQTALVTGGSGFVGRAVVKRLIELGLKVRVLCRKHYPDLEKQGCEIFQGEISDPKLVFNAVKDCELVFHTAAKAGIEEPYSEYERINYNGTVEIVKACLEHNVKRLIYTSSPSVVFSHGDIEGADESLKYPDNHEAYYPKTKCMAEKHVLENNSDKLATVALRPHLIWGPGDNHLGPRLVAKAKAGKLKFVGDGKNLIDTVYIDNAADAHILAAERLYINSPIGGKAYFITNDDPRPISEIVNMILKAAKIDPVEATVNPKVAWMVGFVCEYAYKYLPLKGEPPITRWVAGELATAHWFNIDAAKKDLDYIPKVSIEDGMKKLAEYYNESK